jgi:hypothetical protein
MLGMLGFEQTLRSDRALFPTDRLLALFQWLMDARSSSFFMLAL